MPSGGWHFLVSMSILLHPLLASKVDSATILLPSKSTKNGRGSIQRLHHSSQSTSTSNLTPLCKKVLIFPSKICLVRSLIPSRKIQCVEQHVVSSGVLADDAKGAESFSLLPGLGGSPLLLLILHWCKVPIAVESSCDSSL